MLTAFIKIFSSQTPFTGQNGEVSQRGKKKKKSKYLRYSLIGTVIGIPNRLLNLLASIVN